MHELDGTVEGGQSDFDDTSVQDESLVTGNSSLAEQVQVQLHGPMILGKLELGRMHYVSIVLNFIGSIIMHR